MAYMTIKDHATLEKLKDMSGREPRECPYRGNCNYVIQNTKAGAIMFPEIHLQACNQFPEACELN